MTTTSAPSFTSESTDAAELREWLRANAHPVIDTASDATGTDLTPLTDRLASATVIGLGESTRFAQQTFGIRERVFRALVIEHGFRALAVQDGARPGARLDEYVRTGAGDPEAVLAGAWRPWRTTEMAGALRWIRAFNEANPDDQIRIFGIQPPRAEPADYDAVLEQVSLIAPEQLAALTIHLTPIRTAHQVDEHVQRHQGIHPGRPFAEHARDALALLEALPATPERDIALTHARLIADFHEHSVAGTGSFATDEIRSAAAIVEWHRKTGAKIAYWDGIAHTSALALGTGAAEDSDFRGAGSYLRTHFGPEYISVAIGFHHGDLGMATAPDPAPELIDAALGEVDLPAFTIDLHTAAPPSVDRWRRTPAKARTISGVYDPAKDATANLTVPTLAAAFDHLIHIREVTPVHWLPEASI
ncbi:erythromycin esterase family protein [Nocardia sp. NPDC052566]|uniref:erythromycin esterase family protein n=1 Tax=Nocardia sp. NPDC052566 TaxID=3364330 RepID=UPI0037C905FD